MSAGKILGGIAIIGLAAFMIASVAKMRGQADSSASGINKAVYDTCRDRAKTDEVMAFWQSAKTIRDIENDPANNAIRIVIDEDTWGRLPRPAKVRIGVAGYCLAVGPGGRGSALLRGYRDNLVKASVVDGHYIDGALPGAPHG